MGMCSSMNLTENTLKIEGLCDPAVPPTGLHLHSLLTEVSHQPRGSALVSSVAKGT